MNPKILADLRNVLAKLYPDERSIRRLVDDAGLDAAAMPIDAHAINSWHVVLAEAEKHHQVAELLKAAEREYPQNQPLRQACNAYRQAPAQQKRRQPWRRLLLSGLILLLVIIVGYFGYSYRNGRLPAATPTIAIATADENAGAGVVATPTAPAPAEPATETATMAAPPAATLAATVQPTTTATTPPPTATAPGLRVLSNSLTDNTYLIEGPDSAKVNIGADLVVYAEPILGTEVAIALLKVIGQSPNSLTAQALLVDPQFTIRTRMRVDDKLAYLAESQLIPVFDYVVGYLLRPSRIRLRPNHGLAVGAQLQALAFERSGAEIIDALPMDPAVQLRITELGVDGQVANVALIEGSWPVTGTVVALLPAASAETATAAETPTNTPPVEDEQSFQVRYTATELTGFIRPEPDVGTLAGSCSAFTYKGAASSFVIAKVLTVDYIAMPGQPSKAWAKVTYLDDSNTRHTGFFAEAAGLLGMLELTGGSQEIVAAFTACLE